MNILRTEKNNAGGKPTFFQNLTKYILDIIRNKIQNVCLIWAGFESISYFGKRVLSGREGHQLFFMKKSWCVRKEVGERGST